MSNLNKKVHSKIDEWRHRRIEGEHPYVFLDGIVMKPSWAGEVRNVSLLVAIGVTLDGYREIDPTPDWWTPMIGFRANGRSVRWKEEAPVFSG